MTDAFHLLADLGRQSLPTLWLPIALWTAVAVVAEAGLRASRAHAALGLPVRGAVLAALPGSIALAWIMRTLAPDTASAVAAIAPAPILRLPEIVVGGEPAVAVAAGPPPSDVLIGLLLLVFVGVGVLGLVRLALDVSRLRSLRKGLTPAPRNVGDRLAQTRARLGLRRPVAAVEAPDGVAPFTVGWRRPVVAVPRGLGDPELDAVLTHELAHVKRKDFAWHVGQRAITAVFGAHPLVHVLARGLNLDRERVADAAVIAAHPTSRRPYADLLLSYASLPPPPFALGAAPGSSSLKSRIDAMTHPLSPERLRRALHLGRVLAAAGLLVIAGLAVVTAASAGSTNESALAVASTTQRWVEGRVTDADSREPIPMASLQVVGTQVGAATDLDGMYRMNAPDGDQAILVSAPDYETRTVRLAAGQTELDVALTVEDAVSPNVVRGPDRPGGPDVFEVVEEQPTLIGGLNGIQERVVYPQEAKDEGVQGMVLVQFIVDKDGSVTDPVVLRSPDERLSQAALAAIREAQFEPGRQRGEAVRVRFVVPVTFRLRGEDQGSLLGDPGSVGDRVARAGYRLDGSRLDQPAPERPAQNLGGYDLKGNRVGAEG